MNPVGFVVGLQAEANLVRDLGPVAIGGEDAARSLIGRVGALVSFGLAGGLHPRLLPGYVLVPKRVRVGQDNFECDPRLVEAFGGSTCELLLAVDQIVANRARKALLYQVTDAAGVDMETAGVVKVAREHNLPFAVVRAVCDPFDRSLPPVAQHALDEQGQIRTKFILKSLLERPWEVVDLVKLARDAHKARQGLIKTLNIWRKRGASKCPS
jgi:adenosylhomocysteine nucleosidase